MALNHFASQIKNNQVNDVAKQAIVTTNAPHSNRLDHKNPTAEQPAEKAIAPTLTGEKTINTPIDISGIEKDLNPAKVEIPLSWSDQQMLCALSAMQIRYGRPAEAIPYLMMVRKINPKNAEAARLLALSFMRLDRWNEAEFMIEEYDYLQKSNSGGVVDGIVLLYRSLVSFKTNKVADAKSWFGKFRKFNKVS